MYLTRVIISYDSCQLGRRVRQLAALSIAVVCSFIGVLGGGSGALFAADDLPQEDRLAEINRRVEQESDTLIEVTNEQKTVEAELRDLTTTVRTIQSKEKTLRGALEAKRSASEKLKNDLEAAERKAQALKAASLARLRIIYMQKHQSFLEMVLMVSDHSTLQRHAYFLSKIREFDNHLLQELHGVQREISDRSTKLTKVIDDQKRTHATLEEQQRALAEKLQRREELAKALRTKRSQLEDSIVKLRAEALRLETVLVSLTGKGEATAVNSALRTQHQSEQSERRVEEFHGPGLQGLKGKLPFPVAGKVRPAPQAGEGGVTFRDMVSRKGIEFSCDVGAEAKSVAGGRVIYLGRMAGLGNLVILDHGERYYTLYGRLKDVAVTLGQDISAANPVGTCDTSDNTPTLYFEVRKNGAAVNPRGFLKGL